MAAPTTPPLEQSSPFFLQASDQPGSLLVSQPLNGDNYPTWSRAFTMALQAKNKLGFIDGSLKQPASNSPNLAAWIRCNSMVQSWLVHSTIPSIANSLLWIENAHAVWIDLRDRFSLKNAPRIFEIRRAIANHPQGTDSISSYYTTLKGFWDELSSYLTSPSCSCGAMSILSVTQASDQLMDFLQGLNDSYSAVRSQLLLMDPLPSISKAYSLLL